eukprot:1156649-Pelagomonas_calceolata.AAC.8
MVVIGMIFSRLVIYLPSHTLLGMCMQTSVRQKSVCMHGCHWNDVEPASHLPPKQHAAGICAHAYMVLIEMICGWLVSLPPKPHTAGNVHADPRYAS